MSVRPVRVLDVLTHESSFDNGQSLLCLSMTRSKLTHFNSVPRSFFTTRAPPGSRDCRLSCSRRGQSTSVKRMQRYAILWPTRRPCTPGFWFASDECWNGKADCQIEIETESRGTLRFCCFLLGITCGLGYIQLLKTVGVRT